MDLQVEIRNEELIFNDHRGVLRSGSVSDALEKIQNQVEQKVMAVIPCWRTIGYRMGGKGTRWPEYDLSTRKPTLVIGVNLKTRLKWEAVEDELSWFFEEISEDMEVDFELRVEFYATPGVCH